LNNIRCQNDFAKIQTQTFVFPLLTIGLDKKLHGVLDSIINLSG